MHASRRGVNHFSHTCFHRFPENKTVEKEIRGRTRLVQIDVAAPSMVGSEMKNNFYSLHRRASYARLTQISLHKRYPAVREMLFNV